MTDIVDNLNLFELALLGLLGFVALYFIYLAFKDYRQALTIKQMNDKIRSLIDGDYSEVLKVKSSQDLMALADSLNDLSDVF